MIHDRPAAQPSEPQPREPLQGPYEHPAWFTPTRAEWEYLTGKRSLADFSAYQRELFVRRYGEEQGPVEMRLHNIGLTNYGCWLQDTGFFDAGARY